MIERANKLVGRLRTQDIAINDPPVVAEINTMSLSRCHQASGIYLGSCSVAKDELYRLFLNLSEPYMGYTYRSILRGVLSRDNSANLEESLSDYVNVQEARD